jgi:hypothetical protein
MGDQMSKRLQNANPSGRRHVGRPRARWLDEVNKDAREIIIRTWSRVLDGEEWRTLLEESETLKDL